MRRCTLQRVAAVEHINDVSHGDSVHLSIHVQYWTAIYSNPANDEGVPFVNS